MSLTCQPQSGLAETVPPTIFVESLGLKPQPGWLIWAKLSAFKKELIYCLVMTERHSKAFLPKSVKHSRGTNIFASVLQWKSEKTLISYFSFNEES
jgi:hypothetical protein